VGDRNHVGEADLQDFGCGARVDADQRAAQQRQGQYGRQSGPYATHDVLPDMIMVRVSLGNAFVSRKRSVGKQNADGGKVRRAARVGRLKLSLLKDCAKVSPSM